MDTDPSQGWGGTAAAVAAATAGMEPFAPAPVALQLSTAASVAPAQTKAELVTWCSSSAAQLSQQQQCMSMLDEGGLGTPSCLGSSWQWPAWKPQPPPVPPALLPLLAQQARFPQQVQHLPAAPAMPAASSPRTPGQLLSGALGSSQQLLSLSPRTCLPAFKEVPEPSVDHQVSFHRPAGETTAVLCCACCAPAACLRSGCMSPL